MAMFHTASHLYLSSGVSVIRLSFPATQASLCLTSFFSILSFLSAATIDALSLTLWKRPSPFHCFDRKRHQHSNCHLNSPHLFLFDSYPQNNTGHLKIILNKFCLSNPNRTIFLLEFKSEILGRVHGYLFKVLHLHPPCFASCQE